MYWHQFRSIFKSISLEQLQRCLLQCHPPPFTHKNENEKWPTLGVKNIADKNLLLCCHLFVELLQRLPVEGSLPLVSTLHPSAGVEVEDTLQFVVQITLKERIKCQIFVLDKDTEDLVTGWLRRRCLELGNRYQMPGKKPLENTSDNWAQAETKLHKVWLSKFIGQGRKESQHQQPKSETSLLETSAPLSVL